MKSTIALTVAALLMAGAAHAQEAHVNHWDITKIDLSKLPPASTKADVSFDGDIMPLLKASCVHCHGAERPHGKFRVDSREEILKGGHDGKMVIPGDSEHSLMIVAMAQIDPHTAMPPKHHGRKGADASHPAPPDGAPAKPHTPAKPLTAEQVGLVRAWIDQGAK